MIKSQLIPRLGSLTVSHIRFEHIDAAVSGMVEDELAPKTIHNAVMLLRNMLTGRKGPSAFRNLAGRVQPEHDRRRAPATYDRILKHIGSHSIIVHCTLTRQMLNREGYLREFAAFWSERPEVRKIWFSIFTPQHGHQYEERLSPADRERAVGEIASIREEFRKVYATDPILSGFRRPPVSPDRCIFAMSTTCISADLKTRVEPCQLGGSPICEECGCITSSGLAALGNYKLGGLLPIATIFAGSRAVGNTFARWRRGNDLINDGHGLISIGNARPSQKES